MVKHIFDPDTFGSDFGLTTLSKDEKMFDLSVTNNPSNWLGPIWLVANYVVFRGLLNYGYRMEAEIMYKRTMRLLWRRPGEKQDVFMSITIHLMENRL